MAKKNVVGRLEEIFAHAVALQQNGRLRNSVHCIKKFIYIIDNEQMMMMRFSLKDYETPFEHPVSFYANDYDGKDFREEDGLIIFKTQNKNFQRESTCRVPKFPPKDVQSIFKKQMAKVERKNPVELSEYWLGMLDDALSHVEFSGVEKTLVTTQRNIYTGKVSVIKELSEGTLLGGTKIANFKPIGMVTNNLYALYQVASSVKFYFSKSGVVGFEAKGQTPFVGFVCPCIYDELGG